MYVFVCVGGEGGECDVCDISHHVHVHVHICICIGIGIGIHLCVCARVCV
jgi:hypothetical protein